MNIQDYLEYNNFAGLAIFSLEDLLEAADEYQNFIYSENYQEYLNKKEEYKKQYELDLKDKVERVREAYNKAIENNQIPDDDPDIVMAKVRSVYRNNIINLIRKYFAYNVFATGKLEIKNYNPHLNQQSKDSNDLAVALVPIRRQLYTFLSIVGYYQYKKSYFLSKDDWRAMNYIYGKEVAFVNQPLGYQYNSKISLFLKENRINTGKKKTFIDIDPISLESLIVKYLKTNITQLIEIAHIIRSKFNKASANVWEDIKKEVDEYIKLCEAQRLMIKV